MRTLHDAGRRGFVSDNCAGVHPQVMSALAGADGGHEPSYGADRYTAELRDLVRQHIGEDVEVLPVFNGTGANILSLELLAAAGDAVLCSEHAHLMTSECGAPELHGFKLLAVPAPDGRIAPEVLRETVRALGRNRARPAVLSISQTTELGTCYSLDHLSSLVGEAGRLGLKVHIDGARLANAAAHLGAGLRELTGGADAVSFGASKNGGMFGECVIVRGDPAGRVRSLHKAVGQLPSKTRFVSAQLLALLRDDLWIRNADAANRAAQALASRLEHVPGVRVVHPVEANAVFASLPSGAWAAIGREYSLVPWHETPGVARLMTAYDTMDDDIDALVTVLAGATA